MDEVQEFQKLKDLMNTVCLGDEQAVNLCLDFLNIAHTWDDLIDKDKDIGPVEINRAFCNALGTIPMNPIYQEYIREFAVLSLLSAMTWQVANKFESGNEDELIGSFILRNTLMTLVYFIVLISGTRRYDEEWGIIVGEAFFKEMFNGFGQKFRFFLDEMKDKKNEDHNPMRD